MVSRRIFADPEVFARGAGTHLRARLVLRRSRIAKSRIRGDVLTRQCGLDPVLFLRDQDGVVRVFLNSCRHRGMRLCRTDRDNVRLFRCPYHGWTYGTNGELLAASGEHHYCDGRARQGTARVSFRLRGSASIADSSSVPGTRDAPSLEEWLGDMRWYMDIIFGRTGEIEFVGVPQVWEVECAWKFATDNFTDNFHVFHAAPEPGASWACCRRDPDFASHGHMVTLENGHILHFVPGAPSDRRIPGPRAAEGHCGRMFEQNLNPGQARDRHAHMATAPARCGPISTGCSSRPQATCRRQPIGILNLRLEIP